MQAHLIEVYRLSTPLLFVEKVWDIASLNLTPLHKVRVLCVEEKSKLRGLYRSQSLVPRRSGDVERARMTIAVMAPRLCLPREREDREGDRTMLLALINESAFIACLQATSPSSPIPPHGRGRVVF
ncbi:MAG: hypothetical protein LZF62_480234 [Nitrospira sp.]|nr:MAG: hypothetical protein LZF62_480234 [Nitrospira sp.]